MKKITSFLIGITLVSSLIPFIASAQTVDTQTLYTNALQSVLVLLEQELSSLEAQLATLESNQNTLQGEVNSSSTGQIITATSTFASSTTSSNFTPSPTLTQIQNTIPQVVQSNNPEPVVLGTGSPLAPISNITNPLTGDVITTSTAMPWFIGSDNGYTVYGVFSSSTPDITFTLNENASGHWYESGNTNSNGQEFSNGLLVSPIAVNSVKSCLNSVQVGTKTETYFENGGLSNIEATETVPLYLADIDQFPGTNFNGNGQETITYHNDNGVLEIITNPSISGSINQSQENSESITSLPSSYPIQCTPSKFMYPFGLELE